MIPVKVNPFIYNEERSIGKLKPSEVEDIKIRLYNGESAKQISTSYPFIDGSMISKIRVGKAYPNILSELNTGLMSGKRDRKLNDDVEFAKEVHKYYMDNDHISDQEVAKHFDISIDKAERNRKMLEPFDKMLAPFGYEPILYYGKASIDPDKVKEIRMRVNNNEETISGIAKELGVTRYLIQDIIHHRGAYSD